MISIVEPKSYVVNLWKKQVIKDGLSFRLMRYVLRVDYDQKVLLHNVVTGQLVILSELETSLIESLPKKFEPWMEDLVNNYYLVPTEFDEHQRVKSIRRILRTLNDNQKSKAINHYTILPTTACNANCYYCFESGAKVATMTEQTTERVTDFISSHCQENEPVYLSWFGGEPTVAAKRIDQICEGLQRRGIDYISDMTTNGYLFDEEMVSRAKNLWKLTSIMICFDGAEKNYNSIKAYANAVDNPYYRVLRNIGYLLKKKIFVNLRMNFDLNNYSDFQILLDTAERIYGRDSYLRVTSHPIVGTHVGIDGKINHASDEWFEKKVLEFNSLSRERGLLPKKKEVHSLRFGGCEATSDKSVTITPEGNLVRCPEQFGDDQVTGNVTQGITNQTIIDSWKQFSDFSRCVDCVLYPMCEKIKNCNVGNICTFSLELQCREKEAAKLLYLSWKKDITKRV